MSKLRDNKYSWVTKACQLSALSMVFLLAGCGPVDSLKPQPNVAGASDDQKNNANNADKNKEKKKDAEGVTVGDRKITELKITDITLIDATNDKPTSYITTDGAKAKVKITDEKGEPIEGAKVTFSASGIELKPSNGAVLTNAKGEATVFLAPTNGEDAGAYTMSASAEYYGLTVAGNPFNYSLQALDINFEGLQVAEKTLESGASTLVSVVTKNANTGKYQNKVKVNFSATCGTFEQADVISSSQGNVENTYKSIDEKGELCEGEHAITITSNGGVIDTTKVKIKDIQANSILYSSGDVSLGTKNSGAAGTGKIEFTVYSNGIPVTNQEVELQLIKAPGDFSFVLNGNRDKRILKSDSSGKVAVSLYPGNIPGPVEVKASLVIDRKINALSRNVAIATGRPIQGGITLTPEKNVLSSLFMDSTTITAGLTDRQGNLVPDGTVISFVSEGGTVTPNCSTVAGRCSVTFTSQLPRPYNGRVTVLAFVEGEKDYIDMNGDNVYNRGDKLRNNIGSFYRDDNESLTYDEDNNEFLYKRARKGRSASCGGDEVNRFNVKRLKWNRPNSQMPIWSRLEYKKAENILSKDELKQWESFKAELNWNKIKLAEPNINSTCDNELDTVLRKEIILGFADEQPYYRNQDVKIDKWLKSVVFDLELNRHKDAKYESSGWLNFELYGNPNYSVPMPSGATISVSTNDSSDNDMTCEAKLVGGMSPISGRFKLYRVSDKRGYEFNSFMSSKDVTYSISLNGCDVGDNVLVTVSTTNNKETKTIPIKGSYVTPNEKQEKDVKELARLEAIFLDKASTTKSALYNKEVAEKMLASKQITAEDAQSKYESLKKSDVERKLVDDAKVKALNAQSEVNKAQADYDRANAAYQRAKEASDKARDDLDNYHKTQ